MSYTHFWSRDLNLDPEGFARFVEDMAVILARARDMGIKIAGPNGMGKPELNLQTIAFNGSAQCGHKFRDLGKPFASMIATGVEEKEPPYDPKADPWFSGPFLDTRVCNGNCCGDPFLVDWRYMVRDWERPDTSGRYACSCETHFKPYDLIVTAALVRLKECLGESVVISSENPEHGFDDAKRLCRELFGFNNRFDIQKPQTEVLL